MLHPRDDLGLEIFKFLQAVVSVAESLRFFLNQSTCLMMDLRMVVTLPREDVVEMETPSGSREDGAGSSLRELLS